VFKVTVWVLVNVPATVVLVRGQTMDGWHSCGRQVKVEP
jgi:hypothetical protein